MAFDRYLSAQLAEVRSQRRTVLVIDGALLVSATALMAALFVARFQIDRVEGPPLERPAVEQAPELGFVAITQPVEPPRGCF